MIITRIFTPFIDNFIIELETRFNEQFKEIIPLKSLISANKDTYNIEEFLKASLVYLNDLPVKTQTWLNWDFGKLNRPKQI